MKPVSDKAAADIKNLTDVDATGFKTVIEQQIAEHIVDRHGENGTENQTMKDVNDIARIQYVLDNYDSMERGGKSQAYTTINQNGKPGQFQTVIYIKAVNGTYYAVESVPDTKAKTTYVVSAYFDQSRNIKTGSLQTADAFAPAHTVKTDSANTENANSPATPVIPQTTENGNNNYPQGTGAAESGFVPKTSPVSADTANSRTGTSIAQEMLRRTQQREL